MAEGSLGQPGAGAAQNLTSAAFLPLHRSPQGYFLDAPLIKVPGRLHPVEIFYTQVGLGGRPRQQYSALGGLPRGC